MYEVEAHSDYQTFKKCWKNALKGAELVKEGGPFFLLHPVKDRDLILIWYKTKLGTPRYFHNSKLGKIQNDINPIPIITFKKKIHE